MAVIKPPTTYKQQIEKLRSRGCIIEDETHAIYILAKINYYRLTAYFLPFKRRDNSYLEGTNINSIYNIYEFDRKLRHILFSAIEEVEVFLRSTLAYYHAHKFGALGYLENENYYPKHRHKDFIDKINDEIQKRKEEPFVDHHINNYDSKFPIWVIIEVFSFGMLSFFYKDLPVYAQKNIARTFFNTHYKTLKSWLKCCTDLRNFCAHFGRLYYKKFSAIPDGITELDQTNNRSLFGAVMALKSLYTDTDTDKWNKEVFTSIKNLVVEYGTDIQLIHIGFPADWEAKLTR